MSFMQYRISIAIFFIVISSHNEKDLKISLKPIKSENLVYPGPPYGHQGFW